MRRSTLRPPLGRAAARPAAKAVARALALAVGVGSAVALMHQVRPGLDAPVYTVAQVRAALRRSPGALAGSIVQVRGVLRNAVSFPALERGHALPLVQAWAVRHSAGTVPCAVMGDPCVAAQARLWGPGAVSTPGVAVVVEPAPPLVAALRRLPLVGALWPGQALHAGTLATYRVQVQRAPGSADGVALLVLDTALPHPALLPALVLTDAAEERNRG